MPALASVIQMLFSFLESRVGLAIIAAAVAGVWGHHRASVACAEHEMAARSAAIQAVANERVRESKVADVLSATDHVRVAEATKRSDEMQAIIDELRDQLSKRQPHVKGSPAPIASCDIDASFSRRVRKLDATGNR